jgi:hypothetical protein
MIRKRDSVWTVRLVAVLGLILFGALALGARPALAAPPAPIGPTDIVVPTAPPDPQPCPAGIKCLPPINPCLLDANLCDPPADDPTDEPTDEPADEPTDEPADEPSTDPVEPTRPTSEPADQPRGEPAGIPTPNRIDTGGGPGPAPAPWLYWVVPAFAVLTLLAGLAGWRFARSEQRDGP